MDLSKLAGDLGFDVETVRSLLSRFVEVTERDLLELERSAAAGDGEAAGRIAHHIRGAAAGLELHDVTRAAAAVEAGAGTPTGPASEVARIRTALAEIRAAL